MVDDNQIVYQDESYPLEVCAEITYTGSSPVLTTKVERTVSLRMETTIKRSYVILYF